MGRGPTWEKPAPAISVEKMRRTPRGHDMHIPDEREPRKPARVIASPEAIREATRLFAAGKITRAQLADRIRAQ